MNKLSNNHSSSPVRKAPIHQITRENMDQIHRLLEGGESLEIILKLLKTSASNRAILHIANTNKMNGLQRSDFQARIKEIMESRKRVS